MDDQNFHQQSEISWPTCTLALTSYDWLGSDPESCFNLHSCSRSFFLKLTRLFTNCATLTFLPLLPLLHLRHLFHFYWIFLAFLATNICLFIYSKSVACCSCGVSSLYQHEDVLIVRLRGKELVTVHFFRCVVVILLSRCHFVPWVSSATRSERRWHAAICVVLCCVCGAGFLAGSTTDELPSESSTGSSRPSPTPSPGTCCLEVNVQTHLHTAVLFITFTSLCLLQTTTQRMKKNSNPSFRFSLATRARISWFVRLMWCSWCWIDWNMFEVEC